RSHRAADALPRSSRAAVFLAGRFPGEIDRRRPRALLVRSQAVVVIRRSPVSVAWRDLRTLAGRVRTAAQPTRVDRERRFLDRPHVVQDVARSARKVRIAELDGTAVFGLLAFERFPRILDQPRNRLAGSY